MNTLKTLVFVITLAIALKSFSIETCSNDLECLSLVAKGSTKNTIAKTKHEWGVYSDSRHESCSFRHHLVDDTFGSMVGWAKKEFNISDIRISGELTEFTKYVNYERARLRSNLVLKRIPKPSIVIIHLNPNSLDKAKYIKYFGRTDSDKRKLSKLYGVYDGVQSSKMGSITLFFEGVKKVPCGLVAFKFSSLVFEDFGVIVKGAKFFPDKRPKIK